MFQLFKKTEEKKEPEIVTGSQLLTTAERLNAIMPILQKVAMGDFSQSLEIPEKEDEFTEFLVALSLTIDDLREASKAEKMKYDVVMKKLSEGVYFVRISDGLIVYTNPKFEKMFGYNPGEMIGKNVAIVNAPTNKNPEEVAQEIQEALRVKGEWHGEIENIKKDGTHFWCYANVNEFEHPEYGKVWISMHVDITERKKLEAQLLKNQKEQEIILDSIPAWIFYKDKENRFIKVNEAFCKVMEKTKEELEGKSCFDLYPKEQADAFLKDDLEVIKSAKPKRNIIEPMKSPKGELWVQTDKIPYEDENNNIIGIIGFTIDITERKLFEEKLKKQIEETEQANKLMVGRELEMIKLKQRIKELEATKTS